MIGAVIFLLGGGLQAGAQNISYFYSGRAITGLGVGFLVMIIPLYQAEIAHPSIRGRITGLQQFMLGIGAAVAGKSVLKYTTAQSHGLLQFGLFMEPTSILVIRTITNGVFLSASKSSLLGSLHF